MDFLNKSYAQVTELLRTMTPAARITTVLLMAVVGVSLVFLFRHQTTRTDEYLFGGEVLTQGEIAALEAAFAKQGLSDWDATGNRVRVPRAQRHSYLAAAAEEGAIPASFNNSYESMFKESWTDTRDTRELKKNYAAEQFLAQTLRKMPAIEEARVMINETDLGGFPRRTERRALVAIKPLGAKRLSDEQVMNIRSTIAAGAGVDDGNVTVTDLNGAAFPGAGKGGGLYSIDNPYASSLKYYVNLYQQSISNALTPMYPGVQVAVNVELDKEMTNETTSLKYDDKPTSLQTNTYTKKNTSKSGQPAGRPGAASNGVSSNTSAQIASTDSGNESTLNESREDQNSIVGGIQTRSEKAGLVPEFISASIGIPASHYLKVWKAKILAAGGDPAKAPEPEELKQIETDTVKNIQDTVRSLLPRRPKGDDAYEPITVVTYQETPAPPLEEPGVAKVAGAWLAENWQTLGMFGLAAFGVVFLRGMIRAAQRSPSPEPLDVRESIGVGLGPQDHENVDDANADAAAASLKKRFQNNGRSLRDELSDLVREDPDAAANILKLWISDAA